MKIIEIIEKKKQGLELTAEEIKYFADRVVSGEVAAEQASALLMAVYFKGLTDNEIYELTKAMADSGERIDLSGINGICVDKHSTGGVGDSATFIVAPVLAALGYRVAKLSGRGLGHTGGTLDKLEGIKGFNINLTGEQFIRQVNDIGIAIIGQTADICPADKKLYAIRDITGTVDSIPLIAASILSKKIAGGAKYIVLDVTTGKGAFMQTRERAQELADTLKRIGSKFDLQISTLITDNNEPVSSYVGNSLEVYGALEVLNFGKQNDLRTVSVELAACIVESVEKVSREEARTRANGVIDDKSALSKFLDMIKAQGGELIEFKSLLNARYSVNIKSKFSGYVQSVACKELGLIVSELGGGRKKKEDSIDHSVGIILNRRIGDYIVAGDTLATVHYSMMTDKTIADKVEDCFKISSIKVTKPKLFS